MFPIIVTIALETYALALNAHNSEDNIVKSKTARWQKGEERLTLFLVQCVGPAVDVHDIGVACYTSLIS